MGKATFVKLSSSNHEDFTKVTFVGARCIVPGKNKPNDIASIKKIFFEMNVESSKGT